MKAKTLKHLLFACALASFFRPQQLSGTENPKFDVASVKPAATYLYWEWTSIKGKLK